MPCLLLGKSPIKRLDFEKESFIQSNKVSLEIGIVSDNELPQFIKQDICCAPIQKFNSFANYHNSIIPQQMFSDSTPHSGAKCSCKKSCCLKLYCECFARKSFCQECNCSNCMNNQESLYQRNQAIHSCLMKNPQAFDPKFAPFSKEDSSSIKTLLRGCFCKKSACSKGYCWCYQNGVSCSSICHCLRCKNVSYEPVPSKKQMKKKVYNKILKIKAKKKIKISKSEVKGKERINKMLINSQFYS